ncbi:hypothetical protein UFOVP276_65 [uncultured Caudovirales phage]|uniref:Uncharacterized protein n=1 Tax=uncultured Caudovirales phage TaxID=2100421 RepID=A0A6J5LEZ9_9CAUD|nr:hypothetical protein UFOVP127_202 [uncultured Caudovirales phage]CAB4135083.1 hypothetical protein UFOVP276_65 [uncultured Caudovirales phage]
MAIENTATATNTDAPVATAPVATTHKPINRRPAGKWYHGGVGTILSRATEGTVDGFVEATIMTGGLVGAGLLGYKLVDKYILSGNSDALSVPAGFTCSA